MTNRLRPTPFRPGCTAAEAHRSLLRSLKALKAAEELSVLWFAEIHRRGLFRSLGYGTMILYATGSLGFSRTRAYAFLKLARDLDALPQTRRAVEEGRLPWTKAREVAQVADTESEGEWLKLAGAVGQRRLRVTAKRAKNAAVTQSAGQPALIPAPPTPAASPRAAVTFRLTPVQKETLERIFETLQQRGETGTREEWLLQALQFFAAGGAVAADAPSTTIVLRQCPDCGAAEAGDRSVPPDELAAAHCDAVVQQEGRNRSLLPPSLRRNVLARDRHCCTRPGCRSRRHLQVHHIVPRAVGGRNVLENLATLCASCHRQAHRHETAATLTRRSLVPRDSRPERPP